MSAWSLEDSSESSETKISLLLEVLLLQNCLDNWLDWGGSLDLFDLSGLLANYFQEHSECFTPCNTVCSTFLNGWW